MSEEDRKVHYTLYSDRELVGDLDAVAAALRIPRSTLMRAVLRPSIDRYMDMTPRQIRADLWPVRRVCARRRGRGSHMLPIACDWCGAVFSPLRAMTRFCTVRCASVAGTTRRRKRETEAKRERRQVRRIHEPAFREAEARWSREYRARKRAAGS